MGTYKNVKLVVIILSSIKLWHSNSSLLTDYFKLDLYPPMYNQISSSSGVSISVWHHWLQVFWDVGWCHPNLSWLLWLFDIFLSSFFSSGGH